MLRKSKNIDSLTLGGGGEMQAAQSTVTTCFVGW